VSPAVSYYDKRYMKVYAGFRKFFRTVRLYVTPLCYCFVRGEKEKLVLGVTLMNALRAGNDGWTQ